jgi:hypothetical protein
MFSNWTGAWKTFAAKNLKKFIIWLFIVEKKIGCLEIY